ncbi:signal peptide peptidase SppA, partial [Bacteroidales bacterium OttesenSCG-928-I21]|nr:signal peptide peptidase SppA [Bacteroidales bacterium OttesenSCG-928-I21]
NPGYVSAGFATVEEIRNKLIEFKESGKFIISYASDYTPKSYYLATVADKIYMHPQGSLTWRGMASQVMFYTKLLEKLGVEAQIFRYGQFKSAVEPFMNTEMSEANKLQSLTLINSIWSDMCTKISEIRNISIQSLNEIADNLSLRDAESTIEFGFVDELKHYDEVLAELKTKSNNDVEAELFIDLAKYTKVKSSNIKKNSSTNKIAVVFAEGDIVDGDESRNAIGGDWMAATIRKIREDEDVKAVVLRVNSPGGSGLASEIMWREIKLTNEIKPVVVSMGNYAASGGYYISCPARYIFAQPNTLTGSIGVFGMLPNFKELMNDKLGITIDGVKTNENADFGSTMRPVTEIEREFLQENVEDFYKLFISRVSEGRKMTTEKVDEIGQGRVWSGINAIEIGLVDEIGGLNDAVEKAVELANVSNHIISEYPDQKDVVSIFMNEMTESLSEKTLKTELGETYKILKTIEKIKKMQGIQARMDYMIEIY